MKRQKKCVQEEEPRKRHRRGDAIRPVGAHKKALGGGEATARGSLFLTARGRGKTAAKAGADDPDGTHRGPPKHDRKKPQSTRLFYMLQRV